MSDPNKDVLSPLLNDQEFATLMMAEYDARSKATAISFNRSFRHLGTTAIAAGLSFALVIPNHNAIDLRTEFNSSSVSELDLVNLGLRSKSGGSAVTSLPIVEAEFTLSESFTDTDTQQDSVALEKELSIQVKSTTQERLRIEVYRGGVLREKRILDPLVLPVEQYQELKVGGRTMAVALPQDKSLLVCLKVESAPQAPYVLNRDSMRERAQQYSSRCFFHE
ncbi:MAG: hypothetical protein RJB13_1229 [Pseudomonadota bacterium]|jgi:hypothetical protein